MKKEENMNKLKKEKIEEFNSKDMSALNTFVFNYFMEKVKSFEVVYKQGEITTVKIKSDVNKNEAKRLEEQSKQEELLRKEQEKIEQMKNEYHQLCAEYNSAIDEYNDSTEKFNAFLEKIEPYALLNKTDPLEKRNYIDEDFETFRSNGADFSKISADTDNIRNDADKIESKRIELCELAYKSITDNYNLLAETYNNAVEITSVDYIEDIPKKAITKTYKESESEFDEDEIFKIILQ